MALAKYFSKDLLAINRLINTKQSVLEDTLNETIISIAFDENAVTTFEGRSGLDLITRLISRLYPKLKIVDLSKKHSNKRSELLDLAKEINSNIEIVSTETEEDIYIVAGFSEQKIKTNGVVIYFGSDNWTSKYSISKVQSFNKSENPFGCGISACIVSSNIFRYIFRDYLSNSPLDEELSLSVYSLTEETNKNNPHLGDIIFNDVVIAGIGAIGNGTVWALSNLYHLKGDIVLVDDETVSLSNLQRYVMFKESDIKDVKVEVALKLFSQENLKVEHFKGAWKDYIQHRNEWNINCVAVGIDNEKDRIGIQSSLPRTIFNSFTEPEAIGITRHKDFSIDACLACSYIPLKKKKNFINEVADNCNIADKSEMVKDYYNLDKSVDDIWLPKYDQSLLDVIAKANKIDIAKLSHFKGLKINQFYSDFVCGGVILNLSQTENEITNVDAPLAFQSAMAGILLASELVKYFTDTSLIQELRTDFYHLAPIVNGFNPFHRMIEKDKTNRCLCRDNDFVNRYNEKWKN